MSVTIDTAGKWQPSVLHLLPFSRNDAGEASSSMVTSAANQQASYAPEVNNGGFPSLRNGLSKTGKHRSKSAVVVNDNRYSQKQQQQQQRLLRASSERLSRSQRRFVGKSYIERAQSEYSLKADRKLTQEVVTFAIKDINEQILGRNRQGDSNSSDSETIPKSDNGQYKVKPLLKPVLKPTEGRWPQTNARFWRSSTISPGERELQRHKTSLDVQLSAMKQSKRVKLNVKDLPRSQTPIGENDPDKLNMKHVIAFLQSSGEVYGGVHNDDKDDIDNEKGTKDITKSEKVIDSRKSNGVNDNNMALVIAAKSRRKEDASMQSSLRSKQIGTPNNGDSNHDNTSPLIDNNNISNGDSSKDLTLEVKSRPHSYNAEATNTLMEHGKHHQDRKDKSYRNQRPKSLQVLRENTEFRIPARIRQIRESTTDNRPFRLHRFLTLVSSSSEDRNQTSTKANNRTDGIGSRFTSPSRSNTRSSSTLAETKDDESREISKSQQIRTYTDSNGYFLMTDGSNRNDNKETRKDGRRKSRHPHSYSSKKLGANDTDSNEKIICLPTVPVEVDSDDDFINLPSVPSKTTRKDLVLSAHGHAIMAKHFPQVKTFQKSNIRPHSEKILLKRRLDISNEKTRPSSVKPSDFIEWGGMDNPGQIFITEQNGNDILTNNFMENSNQSPQSTKPNNVSTNEPYIEKLKLESPQRYENSPSSGKMDSPSKSRISDDALCPSGNRTPENANNEQSKDAVNKNSPKSKPELVSPSLSDPVRLTLRKERNLTRELTYMVDMESSGNNVVENKWGNGHIAKNTMS